jgi:pyridoxine 5-phosphate synthase
MTRLSVNINKIATLRNARGKNTPDVIQVAKDCESFGAHGITVHPRPDERHITGEDVRKLSQAVKTEFNIEGNPDERFLELVRHAKPDQVTLVPDAPDAITSNAGWNTVEHKDRLIELVRQFKALGCRVSIFVDPVEQMIEGAKETGTDRIELYTESYAEGYAQSKEKAVEPYARCASLADRLGLGVNAGHDLSLENLAYFCFKLPALKEVSIGHALISESLYFGLQNTIQMYLHQIDKGRSLL